MHGVKREILPNLQILLTLFPCVAVLGARQVGKSTLLKQALPNAPYFDLEKQSDYDLIERDPEFFLSENPCPLVIDEAQHLPDLFKALRVRIDQNRKQNGQYLISGSSSPDLLKQASESLAGRIAIIELGTFSWEECQNIPASDFFTMITQENWDALKTLPVKFTHDQLYKFCLLGGYPDPYLNHTNPLYYDIWMSNYFKTYIDRDIRSLFPHLNLQTFQRLIKMLAFSSGQLINVSNLAQSLDISQPTAKNYIDIANGTFFWRTLHSFQSNHAKQLIKMPKGHIRDTGLLTYLLNIRSVDDLKSHPSLGKIWETFIIEQIIKGLSTTLIPFKTYHYRTRNQAEIDLIIEGPFGLIPVEIKVGKRSRHQDLQAIKSFVETYNSPVGLIINLGENATYLAPKILQLPATLL